LFFREKLGPHRTIAKENGERKEKSQKRPEKCRFFRGDVEIPAENAGRTRARHVWSVRMGTLSPISAEAPGREGING
jgi:hypothetical protein